MFVLKWNIENRLCINDASEIKVRKDLFASTNAEDINQWNLQRIETESKSICFA